MKGQLGLETIFMLTFIILLLVFAFIFYVSRGSEIERVSKYLEARKICYEIQNVVNQVMSDSYGTSVRFYIPVKLEQSDYNIRIDSVKKLIFIWWEDSLTSCPIITPNITNNTFGILYPTFSINKGENLGLNSDGIVVIKQA
jgi:hypothetical protein